MRGHQVIPRGGKITKEVVGKNCTEKVELTLGIGEIGRTWNQEGVQGMVK